MKPNAAIPPLDARRRHYLALLALLLGCLLTVVGPTSKARAEARVALVIGNSTYEHAPWLTNPANDSRLMAETLSGLGFQVLHRSNLTQAELRRAIADFTAAVAATRPDSLALFYYAGHGVQLGGDNYLIPVDSDITNEREVVLGGVSAGDLLRTLELAGPGVNLIILDACRDNPFRRAARGLAIGLARMDAPVGSIIGYATAPGRTASDGLAGNSPYTQALAAALIQPGLPIEQVFKQVRRQVYQWTDGDQLPWEESSLIQDVVLADAAQTPTASSDVPSTAASTAADVGTSRQSAADLPPDEPTPAVAEAPARRDWPDLRTQVQDFIDRYHRTWSGSGTESAADIAAFYGDSIRYYGRTVSRAEVLRDKSRFVARWPLRDYRFDADSLQVTCAAERCSASYRVRFLARQRSENRSSSGIAEARVVLMLEGDGLAIVAEDSEVLSRD